MNYEYEGLQTLSKIAQNFNAKIIPWEDCNYAVQNNISFNIILDSDKYISEREKVLLKDKILFSK